MTTNSNLAASAVDDHRNAGRAPSELQTVVQIAERNGEVWKELTEVRSVSRNGAGFTLTRPCQVGRLVKLVMPLQPEFRAYDHKEPLYPVMGIIQYCNQATIDDKTVFHVGVGFVGKKVPDSFKLDPTQSYRIEGMSKNGLWKVVEAGSQFKHRRDPRYWIRMGVRVSLINQADRSVVRENTYTKNISASGLSIVSELQAMPGDKVKLAFADLDFYAVGVVRDVNRKVPNDLTLHVELLESKFPVHKLVATRLAPIEA